MTFADTPAMLQNASGATIAAGNVVCAGPGCGITFKPRKKWQRFHAPACRNAFHRAKDVEGQQIAELRLRVDAIEREVRELRALLLPCER